MNVKTYLSIDLDYWMMHRDKSSANDFFDKVFEKVFGQEYFRSIPLKIVIEHQHLLEHINKSSARRLANVDYHADIKDHHLAGIRDYNWVGFVEWRGQGEYVWFHPDNESLCNELDKFIRCPNPQPTRSPFSPDYHMRNNQGWRTVRREQDNLDAIDFDDVIEVGITLSPRYTNKSTVSEVRSVLDYYGGRRFRTNEEAHEEIRRILFAKTRGSLRCR